jgi:hypothetical protein
VLDVASDAAERVSTALEASETSFDSSADGGAHARGERSDDSASAGNEDGKSSVGRAVDQGRSDVRDQTRAVGEKAATPVRPSARRARDTVRVQADPVVERARENVEKTVDRAATTLAPTKPVIDKARAIVGRGVVGDMGEGPSEPAPDAAHPATTAPAASEPEPPVGGAPREPLPARAAPGQVRLVTELVKRLVPTPATAASAPPTVRRLASATLRPREDDLREYTSPEQASAARGPVRLDPSDSAVAPLEHPGLFDASSSAPDGGLSSTSSMSSGAAALFAGFCLAAPSLLRRLRLSPAVVRPAAFVSLLERPG